MSHKQIKEVTEIFLLKSDPLSELLLKTTNEDDDSELESIYDPERMLSGMFCSRKIVEGLWAQKNRLDNYFKEGKESVYYSARDRVFPQDKKGSVYGRKNRAGDKLHEVMTHGRVAIRYPDGLTFFDVCGGPGAFSQTLLEETRGRVKGYGITLKDVSKSLSWYRSLLADDRFTPLYGADGTGNVFPPENIENVADVIKHTVDFALADGGFEIKPDPVTNERRENYQELITGRLLLAQILLALETLKEGGDFVCKMFDVFSPFTASLLFCLTYFFESVYIVKPFHSRIVNSERYIAAKGMKSLQNPLTSHLIKVLRKRHAQCQDDKTPKSVVPLKFITVNKGFMKTYQTMAVELAEKQTEGLKLVMDTAEQSQKRSLEDDFSERIAKRRALRRARLEEKQ